MSRSYIEMECPYCKTVELHIMPKYGEEELCHCYSCNKQFTATVDLTVAIHKKDGKAN